MKKELIVSRYKENIDWISDVHESVDSIIVYNKGGEIEHKDPRVKIVRLKNVGREAHSYFYHFINNRYRLAEHTLTCQGDPFDHCPNFLSRLAVDWKGLTSLSTRYKQEWPPQRVVDMDLVSIRNGFEIRMGDMKYFGHRDRKTTRKWFESIWKTVFISECPEHYYYGYSAMWSIPSKLIKYRSLAFWEYFYSILDHQYSTEAYVCSVDAWAFEALWHAILSPQYKTRL